MLEPSLQYPLENQLQPKDILRQDDQVTGPQSEVNRSHWNSRIIRALARVGLSVSLLIGVHELYPGTINQQNAALIGQIAISDLKTEAQNLWQSNTAANSSQPEGLVNNFRLSNGLFKSSDVGWYASIWPSSRALDALYSASLLPGQKSLYQDYKNSLNAIDNNYWAKTINGISGYDQGLKPFHDQANPPLVDDNLWMGLINMRSYNLTRNPNELYRAQDIFKLAVSQWDNSAGGIYWEVQLKSAQDHARAVVSNATAVRLGVELYQKTGDQYYLDQSERIYNWLNKTLLDPKNGLYNDHISISNNIGITKYTYVQGIMIGAMSALNQIDPQKYPLSNAVALADRSMQYFKTHNTYGNSAFDAIWGQNILWLASIYNQPEFTNQAQKSIKDAIKNEPKNPKGLLYASGNVELRALKDLPLKSYRKLY